MIVLSLNVRGIGSNINQQAVKCLVMKNRVDVLCVQESKMQVIDLSLCRKLWGDAAFEWDFVPAENRGGGLICIWRKGFLQNLSCRKDQRFLCISGKRPGEDTTCVFVNVYGPSDRVEKSLLWREIVELKNDFPVACWCVMGDFNAVRSQRERRGGAAINYVLMMETVDFNSFLKELELADLP